MKESPKKDARQLRDSNIDLANYFSNTIIPQLFVDADLILRIFTPPAMEQFSLTYDHVGSSIYDIKDNLRYPYVVEDIEGVIDTNTILEKEVQTTDGNWFQMNIVPYIEHEENRINGVIITFVDITKRLVAIRELEKLNSQHETLMYALSHDIRQPISVMSLVSEGLTLAHKHQDFEKLEKWIKTLKDSTSSLKSLIEDYTSGNIGNAGEGMEQKSLDIRGICKDVVTALKVEIRQKQVDLSTDLEVFQITFPRNNLRSVFYNLVHNAIKFSDSNKCSVVKISTEESEDFVILQVEDNGIGISEEDQKRIFQKSSRFTKDISGTGMGLYVVKKMIEDNDGKIELESKVGEGTIFRIFFKK